MYFVKAGTDVEEVCEGLSKVDKFVRAVGDSLEREGVNLWILNSAFGFFEEYFGGKEFGKLCNFDKAFSIMDLEFKLNCCIELLEGSLTLPFDITTMPK